MNRNKNSGEAEAENTEHQTYVTDSGEHVTVQGRVGISYNGRPVRAMQVVYDSDTYEVPLEIPHTNTEGEWVRVDAIYVTDGGELRVGGSTIEQMSWVAWHYQTVSPLGPPRCTQTGVETSVGDEISYAPRGLVVWRRDGVTLSSGLRNDRQGDV
jgi:hypothetical protein